MDTAGKAVLFSGVTVLISLSAVMLVPSPAFRSMSLGIMLSVLFVLAATLTLLPAVLAKLGPRVDKLGLKWVHSGEHRSQRFAAWGERLWRRPLPYAALALVVLIALAIPVFSLDTGMPSIKVVPEDDSSRQGYVAVQDAFGPGATGPASDRRRERRRADQVAAMAGDDPGIAAVMLEPQPGDGGALDDSGRAGRRTRPTRRSATRSIGCATSFPPASSSAAPVAENHDLEARSRPKTPLVIGVVLVLGFLLLLVALQAPLIAAVGVITNLLATGAAFGVSKLIFQDGNLQSLLGFESQGFLDAWGPVFFFAMIFAISMDYTVFLLSSAKEHWDRSGDPKDAMVGGLAHSGRVDLRRRRGDGGRVLHLRPVGPAAAQGDGRSSSASPSSSTRCWCVCSSCR